MKFYTSLPPAPYFEVDILDDLSDRGPGFLRYVSRLCRLKNEAGACGESFVYDQVDRAALDAVVVVPHFQQLDVAGLPQNWVILRSAARPPVMLRDGSRSPMTEPKNRGLWELPAGLVESDEENPEGLRRAAARELFEETGFDVGPAEFVPLGPSTYPAPGMIAERHFYFEAPVSLASQQTPPLDGSPLEEVGQVIALPLRVALTAMQGGLLADAKTELGLRRLMDKFSNSACEKAKS